MLVPSGSFLNFDEIPTLKHSMVKSHPVIMSISLKTSWAQSLYDTRLSNISNGQTQQPIESVQLSLLKALDDLLSLEDSPEGVATKSASIVISQNEPPLMNLIGLTLNAAENIADEKRLQVLVDYFVALASLPDAVNESAYPMLLDMGGWKKTIEPGRIVVFAEGTMWKDLPGFAWNLTERLQGPEAYMYDLRRPVSPAVAMQTWKNINMFVALLAISSPAQNIPTLSRQVARGRVTLAMALEYSRDTRLGKNVNIHAPAAALWLRVARDEVEGMCMKGDQCIDAGDLWLERGGSNVCDMVRLQFWHERLVELEL
ncbi:hypothetical protein B0J11DRAFT_515198 [Dendryphion nanum]|uniref:Uncharacterized protein n=1 Tax=Dendryphion nanum TaxID=256645 RepID=A0A9P9J1I7_9PLEO|nr:hypothetical protein B0J11DRAFT_515198 [Dendryphion nanum]